MEYSLSRRAKKKKNAHRVEYANLNGNSKGMKNIKLLN